MRTPVAWVVGHLDDDRPAVQDGGIIHNQAGERVDILREPGWANDNGNGRVGRSGCWRDGCRGRGCVGSRDGDGFGW